MLGCTLCHLLCQCCPSLSCKIVSFILPHCIAGATVLGDTNIATVLVNNVTFFLGTAVLLLIANDMERGGEGHAQLGIICS